MKYLFFSALLGLGLAGCSSDSQHNTPTETEAGPTPATASEQTVSPPLAVTADTSPTTPIPAVEPSPAVAPAATRTVAYQGGMSLQVDNFEQATSSLNQLLDQYGAYPSAAHEARANGQHYQEMTLKIPAADFLHVVAALAKLGRIANKDVSATDITADVVALTTRVSARQATAAKYRQLLARATTPAQARQLADQARQLQTELAADNARLQQLGLGSQGLWATLHLRYTQTLPSVEPAAPLPAVAPQLLASFTNGWSVVVSVLVALTNLWPVLLLGAAIWSGARWWRRRHPAEY